MMESAREGYSVLTVRYGRKLPEVRGLYRRRLRSLRRFRPEAVVIHLGHNDIVLHSRYNQNPLFSTVVLHQVREMVEEVSSDFPGARIYVSSILQRVAGGGVRADEIDRYNRMARRFGEMVRSFGNKPESLFKGIVNRALWGRIARWEVLPRNHHEDGLHLNSEGKEILVRGWLRAIDIAVRNQ
jgi:lysophospholipase L1-like esterase